MFRNVGVDLGVKTTHEVVALDPGDESPRVRLRSGHLFSDYEAMLERVSAGLPPEAKLRFVMEPTGTVWMTLAKFLQDRGYMVCVVKTQMVKDQRKVLKHHVKTDALDAIALAKLPWVVPEAIHPLPTLDANLLSLKRRVKQVHRLSTSLARREQRMNALVRLALPVGLQRFAVTTAAGQRLGSHYLNPIRVKALGLQQLTQALQEAVGWETGVQAAQTWHTACLEALRLQGSCTSVDYDELQNEFAMESELYAIEQRQYEDATARMKQLYLLAAPSRQLETVYGVGLVTAAASVAAIGDAHRFGSARQFRGYTGLVPAVSNSGERNSKGKSMSKAGPDYLKWALYMAAETARQWDPQLALLYYNQMVKYGHTHTQALCTVAAHLADRIFVVYRDDRPYELRDLKGCPISPNVAKAYIQEHLSVPEEVRERLRHKEKEKHALIP